MGSAGIAKPEIRSVAQNVVDSLYALDEDCLGFHDPAEETLSGLRTGGKFIKYMHAVIIIFGLVSSQVRNKVGTQIVQLRFDFTSKFKSVCRFEENGHSRRDWSPERDRDFKWHS
jgi:hypothetical protein